MENLKSYEKLALEAIMSGGHFNGKFYSFKKGTFIFVSSKKFQIDNQELFLTELSKSTGVGHAIRNSSDFKNARKHGFDSIER